MSYVKNFSGPDKTLFHLGGHMEKSRISVVTQCFFSINHYNFIVVIVIIIIIVVVVDFPKKKTRPRYN